MAAKARGPGRPQKPVMKPAGDLEARLIRWAKANSLTPDQVADRLGVSGVTSGLWFRRGRRIHPLRRGIVEAMIGSNGGVVRK